MPVAWLRKGHGKSAQGDALRWCVTDTKYILEPSAAAGLAALRKLTPRALETTVVVLTGRNVSWRRFQELVPG